MNDRAFELPAVAPVAEQRGETFPRLVALMQRLLAPDGCPWDREQSLSSLRRYVLEEACEVIDAIDSGDGPHLKEELGDLTLQVVFLSELSRAAHGFGPDDVIHGICEKLVRRHPHVFGDAEVDGADGVARQWESIKEREKGARRRLLDGVPRALPPLTRARELSQRASRVGFDWPDAAGSRDKVAEELEELDRAVASGDRARVGAELGDLLFALVNLARKHGVDAGEALAQSCDRFTRRFAHVEARVLEEHGDWPRDERGKPTRGIPLERLDEHWNEAKRATEEP